MNGTTPARRRWRSLWLTGGLTGAALVIGCGGNTTGPADEVSGLAFVEVTPFFGRVVLPGDSIAFTATGILRDGSRATIEVIWSSRDPSVVTVSDEGWATAVGNGVTTVEASVDGLGGSATVLVDSDTIPPRVVTLFADRTRVTVFQRPAVVRLRADFEDSGSGTKAALALFDGPTGAGITGIVALKRLEEPDAARADPAGPSSHLRAFEGFFEIPANVGVGTWRLTALRADDRAGNVSQWGAEELAALGLTVEIVAVLGGAGG